MQCTNSTLHCHGCLFETHKEKTLHPDSRSLGHDLQHSDWSVYLQEWTIQYTKWPLKGNFSFILFSYTGSTNGIVLGQNFLFDWETRLETVIIWHPKMKIVSKPLWLCLFCKTQTIFWRMSQYIFGPYNKSLWSPMLFWTPLTHCMEKLKHSLKYLFFSFTWGWINDFFGLTIL